MGRFSETTDAAEGQDADLGAEFFGSSLSRAFSA